MRGGLFRRQSIGSGQDRPAAGCAWRRRDRVPPPVSARPAPAAPAPHSDQENRRRRRLSPACPACSPRAPALVRWAERFPCIRTNELDNSLATHFIKISDEQRRSEEHTSELQSLM